MPKYKYIIRTTSSDNLLQSADSAVLSTIAARIIIRDTQKVTQYIFLL